MKLVLLFFVFFSLSFSQSVSAHPGNTASDGCHYCRTNCDKWGVPWNERHCHGGAPINPPTQQISLPTSVPKPTSRPVIPTKTPTPTPTISSTPTLTPTPTVTATPTITPTISIEQLKNATDEEINNEGIVGKFIKTLSNFFTSIF